MSDSGEVTPGNARDLGTFLSGLVGEERKAAELAGEDVFEAIELVRANRMQTPKGQAFQERLGRMVTDNKEFLDGLGEE